MGLTIAFLTNSYHNVDCIPLYLTISPMMVPWYCQIDPHRWERTPLIPPRKKNYYIPLNPILMAFRWWYPQQMVGQTAPLKSAQQIRPCWLRNPRPRPRGGRLLPRSSKQRLALPSGRTWTVKLRIFFNPQGLVNVPIEHHPSIGDIISNRYFKVMFKIPKKGHLTTPDPRRCDIKQIRLGMVCTCWFLWIFRAGKNCGYHITDDFMKISWRFEEVSQWAVILMGMSFGYHQWHYVGDNMVNPW